MPRSAAHLVGLGQKRIPSAIYIKASFRKKVLDTMVDHLMEQMSTVMKLKNPGTNIAYLNPFENSGYELRILVFMPLV